MDEKLTEYKKHVSDRLAALTPIFAKASIGDFSEKLEIPDGDDEFVQLYTGIEIMIEVMKQQLERLNSLNTSLTQKLEELQFIQDQVEQEKSLDEAILESIGDGVVVTDKDMNVTLMNYQAQILLGVTLTESVAKPISAVLRAVNEKLEPISDKALGTTVALSQKKKYSVNYFYLKHDNTPLPVSVTTSPVLLSGQTVGAIVIFKDRTKERKIEELKNEFISLAAHQLRSPLGIMRWNIELYQKENTRMSLESKDKIDSVYKNVQKMITLVSDMLSVSRLDQGKVEHKIEPVNILDTIKEVLEEVKVITENKMIAISFVMPPEDLPLVLADKKRLREVVQNLINNAIKFNIPLGKVEISLRKENGKVVMEISDTGIGVPEADMDHVFEKFYRASNAVLGQTPGTGLGLFLVKSYLEAWGGKVWFESPANMAFRSKIGHIDNPGSSFYAQLNVAKGGV